MKPKTPRARSAARIALEPAVRKAGNLAVALGIGALGVRRVRAQHGG